MTLMQALNDPATQKAAKLAMVIVWGAIFIAYQFC